MLLATCGFPGRTALAAARSLGRAGAFVDVAWDGTDGPALHSRFARRRLRVPDAAREPRRYAEALCEHVRRSRYELLLPSSEPAAIPIVREQASLEPHVGLVLPPAAAFERARDKVSLLELGRELGLAVPRTHAPAGRAELVALAETLSFPVVLKPRQGHGALGVCFAGSADELLAGYDAWPAAGEGVVDFRPLVQEHVGGEVHDVCALFRHGEPRAALTQRRLLMHPAAGGPGIWNETTDDSVLRDAALRLLAALRWHGPAQVEFRRDRRGTPFLLDLNPRLWGTLALAVRAGVDFPALLLRLAREGDVAPVWDYRVGLCHRWPLPEGAAWARAEPRPLRAAWRFVRPARRTASDLWLSDPRPHLAEGLRLLRRALRPHG